MILGRVDKCHAQRLTQFADGGEFGMGAEIGIATKGQWTVTPCLILL